MDPHGSLPKIAKQRKQLNTHDRSLLTCTIYIQRGVPLQQRLYREADGEEKATACVVRACVYFGRKYHASLNILAFDHFFQRVEKPCFLSSEKKNRRKKESKTSAAQAETFYSYTHSSTCRRKDTQDIYICLDINL